MDDDVEMIRLVVDDEPTAPPPPRPAPPPEPELPALPDDATTVDRVEHLLLKALGVLEQGTRWKDGRLALSAIKEARACLELTAKLSGELAQAAQVNVGVVVGDGESRDLEHEIQGLLYINAGLEKAAAMTFPATWDTASALLQFLAVNGPERAKWKDPAEHDGAMRLLRAAARALSVWGHPSDIVPGLPPEGPTGLPEPIQDAIVVPDTPKAPAKPRALPRYSGIPGPSGGTRSNGDCPDTYAR